MLKLMQQIVRRAGVSDLPALLPSVLQLSCAFAYNAKSVKTASLFAQRACEVASQLLKASPSDVLLRRLKLECYRNLTVLFIRWYRNGEALVTSKKLCTEASALFGKDSREVHVALTLHGYCLMVVGGPPNVRSARAILKAVFDQLPPSARPGDAASELRALAGSNYVASLIACGVAEEGVAVLRELCAVTSSRVSAAAVMNLASLFTLVGDLASSIRQLESVIQNAVGSPSEEVLGGYAQLVQCFIDLGRAQDAVALAEGAANRNKRQQGPHELTARFMMLSAEAYALNLDARAAASAQLACNLLDGRFGSNHGTAVLAKARRVTLCCKVGEITRDEALMRLRDCVMSADTIFGKGHPVSGRVQLELYEVQAMEEDDDTDEFPKYALQGLQLLGKTHPDVIRAWELSGICAGHYGDTGGFLDAAKVAYNLAIKYPRGCPTRVNASVTLATAQKETFELVDAVLTLEEECVPFLTCVPPSVSAFVEELKAETAALRIESDFYEMYGVEGDEDDEGWNNEGLGGAGDGEDWEAYAAQQGYGGWDADAPEHEEGEGADEHEEGEESNAEGENTEEDEHHAGPEGDDDAEAEADGDGPHESTESGSDSDETVTSSGESSGSEEDTEGQDEEGADSDADTVPIEQGDNDSGSEGK